MQLSVQADKSTSFPLLAYWLFLPHRPVSKSWSTARQTSPSSAQLGRKISGGGMEAWEALARAQSWFKEKHQSLYIHRTIAPRKLHLFYCRQCIAHSRLLLIFGGTWFHVTKVNLCCWPRMLSVTVVVRKVVILFSTAWMWQPKRETVTASWGGS